MSKITNLSEPWNGHTREEVETFLKSYLPGIEHVTVKINGCAYDDGNETDIYAPVAGGKVIVEAWNPATGENRPRQEIIIPASGSGTERIVEFDIEHGLHYQVHSEVDGLGASFRLTFTSSLENRIVYLWNCSLGVWKCQNSWLYSDELNDGNGGYVGVFPCIAPSGVDCDLEWAKIGDEYNDDGSALCVLFSSAESSFLLAPNDKSDTTLMWSKINYGRNVPGLEEYYETSERDFDTAQELAKTDFSGSLNTDKILSALNDAPAAYFAAASGDYNFYRYLPGAGELYLIYQNKAAINDIINEIDDVAMIDSSWCWSSSAYDRLTVWHVSMDDGDVYYNFKGSLSNVFGVSAFHFYF